MTEEYNTFEQVAWEKVKPGAKALGYFLKGAYDTVASGFRLPTFFRRMDKKQDYLAKVQTDELIRKRYEKIAYNLGIALGCLADIIIVEQIINGIQQDRNSIKYFGIWGMTNIASELYELGRANGRKSKIEKKVEE
jgi:hypothetical protein